MRWIKMKRKKEKKKKIRKRKIFYFIFLAFILVIELAKLDDDKKINYLLEEKSIREEKIVVANKREYYLNIRGRDRTKPILLFLHGGPGVPMTNSMRRYQLPFEDDFVVVNWDQFYTGKSYGLNKNKKIISMEDSVEDLDEIIRILKRDLKQEDLVVVGFSYGTILGVNYINKYENNISAYIGVGQSTNYKREDLEGYKRARDLSSSLLGRSFLDWTIRRIEKDKRPIFKGLAQLIKYQKLSYEKRLNVFQNIWYSLTSSYYGIMDNFSLVASQLNRSQYELKRYMKEDFDIEDRKNYQLPIIFISGAHDYLSSKDLVKTYYDSLETSYKSYRLIEKAGHSPFKESPRQTYLMIKEEAYRALALD